MVNNDIQENPPITFLIHGIWMQGFMMSAMARMLRARGLPTICLSYRFLSKTPAENARLLGEKIARYDATQINLVGHSLGGIVVLHMLDQFPQLPVNKIVLLGSPVNGSIVAKRVNGIPLLRLFLGKSIEDGLLGGAPVYVGKHPLGIVIGKGRWGVTSLLFPSGEDSDGVVREHETDIAGATAKISLPLSHSTMLFAKRCADAVASFLNKGSFE